MYKKGVWNVLTNVLLYRNCRKNSVLPNFEIRHNVETVMQSAILYLLSFLYLLGFLPCGTGG